MKKSHHKKTDSYPRVDVPQASHVPPTQIEQTNANYTDRLYQHHSELANNAVEEYSTKLLLNQGAYWSGSK